MDAILLIIKDYGPAAAALLSIIAVIVVFVVNSKVQRTLRQIIKLKDDTRNEKSKVIVEAFNIINKLEQTNFLDYKLVAVELDVVYNRLYSTVADAKLIQAYDNVIKTFIIGNQASLSEFEVLARKELGLSVVNNKTKQNYLLMINDSESKERARIELEEQRQRELQEIEQQKLALKEQKEQERLLKLQEKEEEKHRKEEEKLRLKQEKKEIKQETQQLVEEPIVEEQIVEEPKIEKEQKQKVITKDIEQIKGPKVIKNKK